MRNSANPCGVINAYNSVILNTSTTASKKIWMRWLSVFIREKNNSCYTCLGDEPYNPLCRGFVEGSDWLLCEAFCLYSQRDRFKPYEKQHSTVREVCQLAQELEIPHLVLWHTEDENYSQRKTLYMEEGRGYYNGDLHVPYDLEVIDLV